MTPRSAILVLCAALAGLLGPRGAGAQDAESGADPEAGPSATLSWVRLAGATHCIAAPALANRVEELLARRVWVPPAPRAPEPQPEPQPEPSGEADPPAEPAAADEPSTAARPEEPARPASTARRLERPDRRARPPEGSVPPASSEVPDPASTELELIRRAHAALRAAPARALMLATEHSVRHPDGTFAQEREVIAIEALARLGQHDEARARARRFFDRYPASSHTPRLRRLVGLPAEP